MLKEKWKSHAAVVGEIHTARGSSEFDCQLSAMRESEVADVGFSDRSMTLSFVSPHTALLSILFYALGLGTCGGSLSIVESRSEIVGLIVGTRVRHCSRSSK